MGQGTHTSFVYWRMRVQLPGACRFANGSHGRCTRAAPLSLSLVHDHAILMSSSNAPADTLRRALRTIPDFPEPGIQFQDITPLLADPELLTQAAHALAQPFADASITHVVGVEARGFILGPLIAGQLGAGFVPVRKAGKLPHDTLTATYDLEYGSDTIELHADTLGPTDRVLIHDDVLATGGTAAATARLVAQTKAALAGYSFLIELTDLHGRNALPESPLAHAVLPVDDA